jgi:hypothetical protein
VAEDTGSPRAWPKPHHLAIGGGGLLLVVLVGLLIFWVLPSAPWSADPNYCQFNPGAPGCPAQPVGACPRPAAAPVPPGFGGQESEVRQLRRRAFAGDFFSQIDLAHRYEGKRSVDQNLRDPVEAAVWYSVALANSDGWSGLDRPVGPVSNSPSVLCALFRCQAPPLDAPKSCRDYEREDAYARLEDIASNLTGPDREAVRDRVIYVMSTHGAPGYLTLARMYDRNYATFGEPWTDPVAMEVNVTNISAIFVRSDADAWLYNYLAAGTGDISGYAALDRFEHYFPDKADALVAAANRWTPPFEFYPPEPPENKPGAMQYSDESRLLDASDDYALREFERVPFVHVGRALCFLQVARCDVVSAHDLDPHAVAAFHALIGEPSNISDPFSLLDAVRAIQLAAVRGSADAQLLLAVMYLEGVGVRADYARSLKWFEKAAHQGSPAAQYAVSGYFSEGVEGVADQDKAAAVATRLASAVDGFHPSAQRLRDLLASICRTHHADKLDRDRHG